MPSRSRACTWKQLVSPAVAVRAPAPRTTQPAAWHRPGSTRAVSGTLTWVRVRVGVGVRARVRARLGLGLGLGLALTKPWP